MSDTLTDIMSLSKSQRYQFDTEAVEQLIEQHGGKQVFALAVHCSERQLQRTITNVCRNPRLQRDILMQLDVADPCEIGEILD